MLKACYKGKSITFTYATARVVAILLYDVAYDAWVQFILKPS